MTDEARFGGKSGRHLLDPSLTGQIILACGLSRRWLKLVESVSSATSSAATAPRASDTADRSRVLARESKCLAPSNKSWDGDKTT